MKTCYNETVRTVYSTSMLPKIVLQGIIYSLGYVKFAALTFVFIDIVAVILILTMHTSLQAAILKMIVFTLRIEGSNIVLTTADFAAFFSIWWVIVSIVMEIIKKFTDLKIKDSTTFVSLFFFLICIHALAMISLGWFWMPFVFFLMSCLSLSVFFLLSSFVNILTRLIPFAEKAGRITK